LLVITWQPARKPLRTARWSLIFDGGAHDSSALTARPAPNDPDVVGCEWLTPEEALALLTPAIADRLRRWRARPAGSGTLFFVQQLFD
jgi:predicted amidohydrolase YtcJ